MSETPNQWGWGYADYITLHPYSVVNPRDYYHQEQGFGIAAGEDIGIRDPIQVPLGTVWPSQPVGPLVSVGTAAARVLASATATATTPGPVATGTGGAPPIPSNGDTEGPISDEGSQPAYGDDPDQTTWDEFYEAYEALNPDTVIPPDATEDPYGDTQGANMAWTDLVLGAVDILDDGVYGNLGGGGPASFAPPVSVPGPGPVITGGAQAATPAHSNLRWDARTGKWVCKRRRRRRLLTDSDFNDLMRISTLPSSKNVSLALAKAVGRRS